MIPTFNSAKYLEATLQSVLRQAGDLSIEVVVVDNGSTDETESIVRATGGNRVAFIKNDQNYGVMGNFNRCVALAKGELVHILNSDDLVLPVFYKTYEEAFARHPDVYIITSNSEIIDDNERHISFTQPLPHLAQPGNAINDFMYANPVRTPAVVVRKAAYERVGDFNTTLFQCGDWDMWTRVVHAFKGMHLDQVLTKYREHSNNESSKVYVSGANILDTERLYNMFLERGYPIEKKHFLGIITFKAYEQYLHLRLAHNSHAATLKAIFERLNNAYKAEAAWLEEVKHQAARLWLQMKRTLKRWLIQFKKSKLSTQP